MKKLVAILIFIVLSFNLAGCAGDTSKNVDYILEEDSTTVLVKDDSNQEVLADKKPERTILLNNSLLDLWYVAGGTAVARVSGTSNVPDEAMDLPDLGTLANISVEELLSLQPNLVIMADNIDAQKNMRSILEESGIQVISLRYGTYQDTVDILKLFTSITDRDDIYKDVVTKLEKDIEDVVKKAPTDTDVSAVVLFTSSRSIMVELDDTFTGDILKKMNGINIAADGIPLDSSPDKAAFSLETIIVRDPDVILINTMGDEEAAKENLKNEVEGNPAWAGLRAVKEGRVYYLPKEMFIFKPGVNTAKAFEYIGTVLYPEVFGNVQE